MKIFSRIRLKTGILVVIGVSIISTTALLSVFFIKTYRISLEGTLKNRAKILAEELADSCMNVLYSNEQKTLQYLVESVAFEDNVESIQVYNSESIQIVGSKTINPDIDSLVMDKVNVSNLSHTTYRYIPKEKSRFYEVISPIFLYDKLINMVGVSVPGDDENSNQSKDLAGALKIIVSFENIDKEIARVASIMIIISVIVIIFGLALSVISSKVLLNSINKLVVGVQKMSEGNFSYRVSSVNIEEIDLLIRAFNSMGETLERTLESLSKEKKELLKTKEDLERLMTEMRGVQEKLLDSEKFATTGRLAAVLAHELKNPLTSLKNIMYFFSQTKDFSDEKSARMLNTFFSEVDRISRIISELLSFSRLTNIQKSFIYIDEIVISAVFSANLPKNIKIEKDLEHFEAKVDSSRIKQALVHLIGNAKDSMSAGGNIYISVKRFKTFFIIKIKDTGCGIKDSIIKDIWAPLFTTKLQAVGLGLAVVKKIIDLHCGTIEVTSKENKGSEFIINIPVSDVEGLIE
ncbi:MAG: HAMP domain-containing protein [Endomicrobium sp.]|jgi:signal transduction histidine kinase|nr:HAMP domain-containing protein [Endomicrobium sp.]